MNFTGETQIPSDGRSSPAKPVSACGAVVCTNAAIPFSVWKRKTEYWREYFKLLRKYRHRVYIYRCTLYFRRNTRSLCSPPYAKVSAALEGNFSSNDSLLWNVSVSLLYQ